MGTTRRLLLFFAGASVLGIAAGSGFPVARAHAMQPGDPAVVGTSLTSGGYSRAVTKICVGALLFEGRHAIGTRAGAMAVSTDIRTTGDRRLRRVEAVPKPARTARLARRWIATERLLVATYAWAYLRIWGAIERARTPTERARLPMVLHALIHAPDKLAGAASTLEQQLQVPDCTGGQPQQTQGDPATPA